MQGVGDQGAIKDPLTLLGYKGNREHLGGEKHIAEWAKE
jgi:hypothetical protein